jgi:uncharacterized protein (DUF983 family)
LLGRGIRKRCPRCGGGDLYPTWFHMVERCPTCGIRFEREPGFFVGAYLVNFAIAIGALFALSMGFVALKAVDPQAGVAGPLAVGVVIAVASPLLCYPFSRTVWSAIDIGMTPIEPDEESDAAAALDATRSSPSHEHPPRTVARGGSARPHRRI